ncbi:MAG: carboxypeptidase-like regulatory domain-containing protein, partial [Ilumatobacteraceae bacterium]
MKVDTLTPVLVAAPGDRATCRLRIENDGAAAVAYRLRIVGFDDAHVLRPPPSGPLAAGASEDVALDFVIPEAFAAGHHSVAVEVVADRPGVAPAIAAVTVTVGTIEDVAMAVVPSTMRAHRRASFRLDIDNRSNRVVDLELDGAGPDLDVRLRPDRVVLRPGERVRTSGRVKGPRHLTGEPLQHSLTVTARSSSAPSYAPATFQQRPLLPKGLRSLVAILLIVGIWAGALGAGFLWWNNRNDEAEQAEVAELVDTDGDGVPDTPGDQLVDTDGDGTPDTLASVVAEEVAAAGEAGPPQAGGGDRPTRTVMGGSVKAADGGDPSGVAVTLIPRDLGAPPAADDAPAPAGLTGVAGQSRGVKLWPARFGRHQTVGQSAVRRTQTIQSTATGEDGAWLFSDVAVGQSYEVSFALAGYDTQSFIVTPSADGKPVQLAVDLKAAAGSVSGSVVGPRGPLANVDLVLTDGTLRFNSSSASGADQGSFSFPGVSTPGTYTLTANLRGFGTEVLQVTLAPGEQLDGLRIGMTAGVGSISGRVTENGEPLGGVRLTASNGDTTAETTSLTEGDRGSFTFPQLAIPGRYTVTASLEGYSTQTRLVVLDGNVSGVDFDFVKTTGAIIGTVASSTGIDLPGTNIRVSRDEIAFDTKSAVEPDPGSFTITDLPPGTYLVEFSRYDHAPYSQSVEIGAGQVVDLGRIVLEFRGRPTIPQNGSLEVRVINSLGDPLNGATVRVFDVSSGALVAEQSDAATPAAPDGTRSTFLFAPLDIGTYRIEVSKDDTYRVSTRRTSVGLQPKQEIIPLYRLGQASGRVIDSFTKAQLIDYDIQIFRINPDGSETFVQGIPVTADTPLTDTPDGPQIRWETAAASLTSGTYRVVVVNPPPGYRVVPDQELVAGLPDMQFVISPTDDTPLNLNDIEADRYPEVAGTVLAPQLSGTDVTFEQITAGGLTVELTCPGTDGEPESVLLNAPRPVLPPGSQAPDPGLEDTGGGAAYDSFFFDRVTLESNDLSGDCTLTVNADGYEPAVIPVLVSPGDGSSDPLVFRNVAMIRPDNVGGTTYWTDDGVTPPARRRDTAGVEVRSQGRVIVRFDPGITERTEPRSDPSVVPAGTALVQTTDATGGWAFIDPRQVFGSTNYVFGAPGRFADRIVTIELAEDGRTVTPGPGPGATLGIDATNPAIDVELDAAGGVITAQVQIATIKGTPSSPGVVNLDGFQVALTGANTATSAPTRFGANAGGVQQARATFSVLDPGTHQVEVTSTAVSGPRPLFDRVGPQPPAFLQSPGTNVTVPPVTFVERGAINVGVNDVAGNPIPGMTVNIVQASDGTNFPVTLAGSPATVVQAGLPVSTTIGALTPYNVSLAANDALDASTAQLSLFNENDALVRTCLLITPGCGTVNIAQGGQPRVVI